MEKKDLVVCLLLILLTSIIYSPFLFKEMPRTDAMAFYFRSWFIYSNLVKFSPFYFNDLWYQGTFLYTFYPPLSFFLPSIFKLFLPFIELFRIFNITIFLYIQLYVISLYLLFRYLKFSHLTSAISSLFSATIPRITTIASFTGAIPSIASFSMFPITTLFILMALNKRRLEYFILATLCFSILFLFHHTSALFYVIGILIPIGIIKIKEIFDRKTFLYLLFSIILFILLTSFWIIPFIKESKYFYPGEVESFNISLLFNFVDEKCQSYECLESLGIFIWIFSFIGVLLTFIDLTYENGSFKISFVKLAEREKIILFLILFSFLLLIFQFFGFHRNLPLFSQVRWERVSFLIIFPLSLSVPHILEKTKGSLWFILLIFLIISTTHQSVVAFLRNSDYLSEAAAIEKSPFDPLYNFLNSQPYGRIQSYGIYYPTFYPSLSLKTEMPVISGWYPEGDPKYKSFCGRIEDLSGRANFIDNISKRDFLNILNLTGTKYVILNFCSLEGQRVYKYFDNETTPIARFGECIFVLNTSFNSFSDPYLDYKRINPHEHAFYNARNGTYLFKFTYYSYWKAYCDEKEIPVYNESWLIRIDLDGNCNQILLKFEVPKIYVILHYLSILSFVLTLAISIHLILRKSKNK